MTQITRLFDFPYHQLEKNNIADCMATKYNGVWVKTSTQEYVDKANAISRALLRLGILENDKIALISSSNRTEWNRAVTNVERNFAFARDTVQT